MLKKFNFFKNSSHKEPIDATLEDANSLCDEMLTKELSHLKIPLQKYTTDEAVEELGLDEELVHQLLEDYVAQVIKASLQFENYLKELYDKKEDLKEDDWGKFRDLAHKNLGVARNLRIKDAEILLTELMTHDDFEYLHNCLDALRACSIKLKPECAYKTLKLIEVKSSL